MNLINVQPTNHSTMKKLTKRQIILAGLAVAKVVYPNVEHPSFAGVYVSPCHPLNALIKTSMGKWSSEELMGSIYDRLANITCAKADEQCNGIIEECQRQINDAKDKAIALYPCVDNETRKHISFDGGNWYNFSLGNSEAHCYYDSARITKSATIRCGEDNTEARLLMDFYLHPIDHKASGPYAKQIKECEQRLSELKDEYKRITLEDFIESGQCAEVLKSMGITEF